MRPAQCGTLTPVADEIREYHKRFYVPQLTSAIVVGCAPSQQMLDAFAAALDGALDRQPGPAIPPVPPVSFPEDKDVEEEFPSEDSDEGIVGLGYQHR